MCVHYKQVQTNVHVREFKNMLNKLFCCGDLFFMTTVHLIIN